MKRILSLKVLMAAGIAALAQSVPSPASPQSRVAGWFVGYNFGF